MSSTFLLEIGTEELPADFVHSAMDQLKRLTASDLKEQRLDHSAIRVNASPRRLIITVELLPDHQPDCFEEHKGPPLSKAFPDGVPGPAAIGFAKRCGVNPSELETRETSKGSFIFATVRNVCYLLQSVNKRTQILTFSGF